VVLKNYRGETYRYANPAPVLVEEKRSAVNDCR
jgi:hypothetical protein